MANWRPIDYPLMISAAMNAKHRSFETEQTDDATGVVIRRYIQHEIIWTEELALNRKPATPVTVDEEPKTYGVQL